MERKMNLSKVQKRALIYLSKQNDWTNKTPVTQKCLNVLHRKGLVKVAYDNGLGWCEKITERGKTEIEGENIRK